MRSIIIHILDFFYPIVRRFIPKETYYYAACGVGNLVLSWFLFFFFYQIVFHKEVSHFYVSWFGYKHIALSAYTLSSACCFCISFSIGFLLMKYVVFTESELKGFVQLFRYGLSSLASSILSWLFLKFLIETLNVFPSIANVLASCIVVIFSYIMQRKFTFK
jgi:putative flippase GtrA